MKTPVLLDVSAQCANLEVGTGQCHAGFGWCNLSAKAQAWQMRGLVLKEGGMRNENRVGLFVSIDGPSGVGKTTACTGLVAQLRAAGESVHATSEPTTTPLGGFVRAHADTYHGMALACLVAGDRHHHVTSEILPALRSGALVVTDRYLPTSLVLQVRDGVSPESVWQINQGVPIPDLAVILTGHIEVISRRLARRGAQDRFETALDLGEVQRFADVAEELDAAGWPVYVLDCSELSPEDAVADLTTKIAQVDPRRGGEGRGS